LSSIPIGATRARSEIPVEIVARHGAIALWAIASVLVAGTLIDLGVLWIGQRNPTPQWEYVALVNTIESLSGLVLAAGLAYLAVLVGGLGSVAGYRILAGTVLALGAVGGALGLLLATDYFVLRGSIPPEGTTAFNTTTFKGIGLSALYFLVLVPLGVFGLRMRRPKRRRANR
jgi:hypothetical protein